VKILAIIGSGDLGQLIAYHALQTNKYNKVVFFDDFKKNNEVVGYGTNIGKTNEILEKFNKNEFDELIIGIGYKHMNIRAKLFNEFYNHITFANIIHDTSYIEKNVSLGEGNVILPGCVIDCNSKIGNNVLINTGCIIAHDATVKSHCFLGPGVNVAGFTEINECCIIGIGTTIIDNIKISSNIRTGGGAVVVQNLTEEGVYVGVPAKKLNK
jgi:sugar O-acyltransferase (sialic acid O-acetyltransferase NeuD family)